MANWEEVKDNRITRFANIIKNYCDQRLDTMTPLAANKARASLSSLLQNAIDRAPQFKGAPSSVMKSLEDTSFIARCSENQATSIARTLVYNYVSDSAVDIYPVSAKEKIERAIHKEENCNVSTDEITDKDALYFIFTGMFAKNAPNGNYQKASIQFLQNKGFSNAEPVVLAWYYMHEGSHQVSEIETYKSVPAKYDSAVDSLEEKGYLIKHEDNSYSYYSGTSTLCPAKMYTQASPMPHSTNVEETSNPMKETTVEENMMAIEKTDATSNSVVNNGRSLNSKIAWFSRLIALIRRRKSKTA